MSKATIDLNAVDNTRGAFLTVQRNLQGVTKSVGINSSAVASLARRYIGLAAVATATSAKIREVMTSVEDIKELDPAVAASVLSLKNDFESLFGSADSAMSRIAATILGGLGNFGRGFGRIIANPFDKAARKVDEANDELRSMELLLKEINKNPLVITAETGSKGAFKSTQDTMIKLQEMGVVLSSVYTVVGKSLSMKENITNLRQLDEELSSIADKIRELRESPLTDKDDAPGRLKELVETYNLQKKKMEEVDVLGKRILIQEEQRGKIAKEASKILAEGFEDAIFSGKKLSEVVKQLGQDILRMVFRNVITQPIAKGITNLLGFADGGLPPTGRASIVGERGPELFIPGTSGRIVPNHELGVSGGGGATYYIDARGADQTGLARLEGLIRETRASIRPIALASVIDARARGGAMARAA